MLQWKKKKKKQRQYEIVIKLFTCHFGGSFSYLHPYCKCVIVHVLLALQEVSSAAFFTVTVSVSQKGLRTVPLEGLSPHANIDKDGLRNLCHFHTGLGRGSVYNLRGAMCSSVCCTQHP